MFRGSMLAEDFTIGGERANRLEAVKQVTQKFIEGRPNDRIGIVCFAGRPYLVSPLTLDHDWLLQNLERVRIGLVEDGTAIGSAIASAANRLKDKEAKSKIVVLLTDGDNNAGKVTPVTAAEAAKALGIKVYTIGAGTRGYAPMPVQDILDAATDLSQNVKVGRGRGRRLKKIAEIDGRKFYRATDTKTLKQIFEQIDKLEKSTVELNQYKQYRDLFPWFLGAGFGAARAADRARANGGEEAAMTFGQPLWFWALRALSGVLLALFFCAMKRGARNCCASSWRRGCRSGWRAR